MNFGKKGSLIRGARSYSRRAYIYGRIGSQARFMGKLGTEQQNREEREQSVIEMD